MKVNIAEVRHVVELLSQERDNGAIPRGTAWLCYKPTRKPSSKERRAVQEIGFARGSSSDYWVYPPGIIKSRLWARFEKYLVPVRLGSQRRRSASTQRQASIGETCRAAKLLSDANALGHIPKGEAWLFYKPHQSLKDDERIVTRRVGLTDIGKERTRTLTGANKRVTRKSSLATVGPEYYVYPASAKKFLQPVKGGDAFYMRLPGSFEMGDDR